VHALVVGGGIAGLSTAIGLLRAGIEVTVFEAASALREAGAGLNLWVNGMAALEHHGLAAAISDVGSTIEIQESRSRLGIRYSSVPVGRLARSYGLPPPAVLRRTDLLSVLASAVPADAIRLAARGVDFDADASGVTLHLADGRQARGSLLVGADGINSAVRGRLCPGTRARYAGYQSLRGLVRYQHDLVTPGTFTMTHGRGDRFGFSSAGRGWLWWFGGDASTRGLEGSSRRPQVGAAPALRPVRRPSARNHRRDASGGGTAKRRT
jgi:2-polyprenyl-6-methoxyphenol hydroxylase-like FAD-dependent oxidoreductase